jgi:hypothetical protein
MLNFLKPKKKFVLTETIKKRIEKGKLYIINSRNRPTRRDKGWYVL